MATIKEWEQEIFKLDLSTLNELIQAIQTLENWWMFKKEYDWSGHSTLLIILQEAERRKKEEIKELNKKINQQTKTEG